MKLLFEFIKAHINANIPDIKTVRMWRNQYSRSENERDERAFRYPAVFIEFLTGDYANNAIGFRDVELVVRFHIGVESYMLEKNEDYDLLDELDKFIFRFRGNENDPVHFTSMRKIGMVDLPDDDNVNLLTVDYECILRELPGYEEGVPFAPVDLDLDVQPGLDPSAIKGNLQGDLQNEL